MSAGGLEAHRSAAAARTAHAVPAEAVGGKKHSADGCKQNLYKYKPPGCYRLSGDRWEGR